MIRGLVKLGLIATVVAGAAGFGYYKYASSRLQAKGVVTASVCRPTASLTGATLPLTFQAFVKGEEDHNWLDSGKKATGLVSARFEWSHGGQAWVEDKDFAERQAADVRKRQQLREAGIGDLIAKLRSEDAFDREIASKELKIRTRGETHGYRYDAPQEEREKAVKAWEGWWAKPATQATYGGRRAADWLERAAEKVGEWTK